MKFTRRKLLSALPAGLMFQTLGRRAMAENSPEVKTRMRLGSVTYNIAKDWDIPTLIKNFEAAGFQGVELRTSHAHGVEVSLTAEQRAEVKKRFADSQIELMGLGSAFEFHMPEAQKLRAEIEACKKYIELASQVGATGVKVRPNALPKDIPVPRTLEQIGRSLNELGRFASGLGQEIRLEVHGAGTSQLSHIKTIMDVADHKNVGVCWNSNQTDLEGKGFEANFDLVKNKIFSVHLRDLYLEEYPFRRLFERLNESGFTGYCLAEIPASTDPVRVLRYFRGLWMALQRP
ncbi:MAG TPA: sugar phosphate isomerase/epimerase family protein [Verrucomicrobiae bacterium]|nr:sugar phosphate isomerase/epimerase family protein [Verrucomicrobiae bacterium]